MVDCKFGSGNDLTILYVYKMSYIIKLSTIVLNSGDQFKNMVSASTKHLTMHLTHYDNIIPLLNVVKISKVQLVENNKGNHIRITSTESWISFYLFTIN